MMKKYSSLALSIYLVLTGIILKAQTQNSTLLKEQAFIALKENEMELARKKFLQIIDQFPDDHELIGLCFNNIGVIDIREGFKSRGVEYLQKALFAYEKTNQDSLIARCLYNNGVLYKRLAQYERAADVLIRAQELFEKYELFVDLSKAQTVLGNLFKHLNDYNLAIDYHSKAINVAEKLKDSAQLAKYYNNRGKTYVEMEYYDDAIHDFNTALNIKQILSLKKSSAYTLYNLGEAEFLKGQLLKAESFLSASKNIHEKFNNQLELIHCYNYLGRIYSKMEKWEKAKDYLSRALDYAQEEEDNYLKLKNYLYQSELYENIGNSSKALKFYKLHSGLYEEILNFEKQKAISELQIKYEVDKREKENQLLNKESEINALKIRQQESTIDTWQNATYLFLLFIMFSSYLGYRYYRLSKKEKSIAERERRLNQEQHHRIKNHLQVLAGLLSFQQKKIEDTVANEVIEESKNRVTIITMLHQHFYQNDDLSSTHVQLDTYLKALIDNLLILYKRDRLKTDIHLESILLETDKVLPLGLICNEIISNAFKYGLNDSNPFLQIQLRKKNKFIELFIMDNGKGFKEDKITSSFGLDLIRQLTNQMDAELKMEAENGTIYCLTFKI